MKFTPQIAIITANPLEGQGLAEMIKRMMPMGEACIFHDFEEMQKENNGQFFHFFITGHVLLQHSEFFTPLCHRTIVLINGTDTGCIPNAFRTINTHQTETNFTRQLLSIFHSGHGTNSQTPRPHILPTPLTPRETEVLHFVAMGLINKEIAEKLQVGLTTVISHRKNLTEKLGIKSVSGLTVYAVMHGIVKLEDI